MMFLLEMIADMRNLLFFVFCIISCNIAYSCDCFQHYSQPVAYAYQQPIVSTYQVSNNVSYVPVIVQDNRVITTVENRLIYVPVFYNTYRYNYYPAVINYGYYNNQWVKYNY